MFKSSNGRLLISNPLLLGSCVLGGVFAGVFVVCIVCSMYGVGSAAGYMVWERYMDYRRARVNESTTGEGASFGDVDGDGYRFGWMGKRLGWRVDDEDTSRSRERVTARSRPRRGADGKGAGGKIGKKKRKKIKPRLTKGEPEIGRHCDEANIRRVVNAKSNAIRYCFEKELQMNPKLSGKIVVQWEVGLDGTVACVSTASTSMKNEKVEGCINRVIKRMRFQKPDGGSCLISYPFEFSGVE